MCVHTGWRNRRLSCWHLCKSLHLLCFADINIAWISWQILVSPEKKKVSFSAIHKNTVWHFWQFYNTYSGVWLGPRIMKWYLRDNVNCQEEWRCRGKSKMRLQHYDVFLYSPTYAAIALALLWLCSFSAVLLLCSNYFLIVDNQSEPVTWCTHAFTVTGFSLWVWGREELLHN